MKVTTQFFKSGNSLALRVPKSLGFAREGMQVEIVVSGHELHLRPVEKRSLDQLMNKFSAFSDDFMTQDRLEQEQQERDIL